ncbi:hypothetical protein [uncultured Agrobacterium sp.]|uniref:hypothetical protein n=1 Tax=uncultured Agrobacterium sp. TaxID=157277 RepID=UPI0025FBE353|nr:hypothetical protein [uncultured Agrobacterium sp.]
MLRAGRFVLLPLFLLEDGDVLLDLPHQIDKALQAFADERGLDKQEALYRILRERLIEEGHLSSGEEGIPPEKLNASNDD